MKGFFFFILFLCFLPAVVALAHDGYIYYEEGQKAFYFISFGWIVTTYVPDIHADILSFLNAHDSKLGLEMYGTFLEQRAVVFSLVLPAFVLLLSACIKGVQIVTHRLSLQRKIAASKRAPITKNQILGRKTIEMKYKRR